ncbi:MAG: chemotaxis protein CheW [Mycobacterium sp.]|jgi:purine-binding chemotaxis protein CheW|nr:chemotaxis protein CheW [Mycobacterium sp.]
MDNAQYCTFELDQHVFGIPVGDVQEVLASQRVRRVPGATSEVAGLLNLRGEIVTRLDLRPRLQLAATSTSEEPRLDMVVRTADGPVSLVVDAVGDVLSLGVEDLDEVPDTVPQALRSVVRAVHQAPDRLLLILDTATATCIVSAA